MDMFGDTRCIRAVLDKLIVDEGKDALLIAHSSAGFVTAEAIDPELGKEHRQGQGLSGGATYLVYMSASVAPVGFVACGYVWRCNAAVDPCSCS